ncbi:helix-turn-helix transcriptional regulator [Clostridium botulinum]|uniref:helix-turn-helix domain-containing protein n=1 Tax=Clostridium botulinum TaxID=1491 RepID=UPI0005F8ACAF|nr:helix-turn-helix transcriptional regulator [Clostridium botulinum]MBY6800160.1 helix-turn-helix transcriptional regulator [Clostridium botulinum]NFF20621.1 helix-turn-helix transcriptional regulator [Clostridium botulinum]NFM74772.1 helix-turn-helix transcriptional regulator [Clostridium botulinum]NFP79393.1 helix-turn-helix transcriptional regulator [Clostridium botulinum]NFP93548.1 helix-turn-helix transcriptional regulator [Clostridium botulinum]
MSKLKEILDAKRMSVYRLAKKADIGQATAHELVHGTREPLVSTARKIASVLNCSIEEIFFEEEKK